MAERILFREFSRQELAAPLIVLEEKRAKLVKLRWSIAAPLGGMGLLALLGVRGNGLWLYVLLGLAAVVIAVVVAGRHKELRAEFKREIVTRVVRYFSPALRYSPSGGIDRAKFRRGELFKQGIDRYRAEDLVAGKLELTEFEVSEVHAEHRRTTRDSKGRTSTTWHSTFRGLYFVADFNKAFHGQTVVLPDSLEKVFGWLGQKLQGINLVRGELIKLEDVEFEKAFVVYGDDQVEARYILTPALMQRMLELRRKVGGRVYFSFTGSQVHVAIPSNKNHFEPRLSRSLMLDHSAEEYYQDLVLVTGIIEDMNLNTRIWTKE